MPTYDYRCAKCGEDLEVYQTFSEAPLTRHKGCGGKLSKVLSPAGIVLKGSGFYKTDNRSSGKRSPADANGKGSSSNGDSHKASDAQSPDSKNSDSKSSDSKSSGDSQSPSSSSSDSKKPAAKSA
jgi:putative FmdB family regulatory protein